MSVYSFTELIVNALMWIILTAIVTCGAVAISSNLKNKDEDD